MTTERMSTLSATHRRLAFAWMPFIAALASTAAGEPKPCTSDPSYVYPLKSWERVPPAQAGWAVEELEAAKAYARSIGSHTRRESR